MPNQDNKDAIRHLPEKTFDIISQVIGFIHEADEKKSMKGTKGFEDKQ